MSNITGELTHGPTGATVKMKSGKLDSGTVVESLNFWTPNVLVHRSQFTNGTVSNDFASEDVHLGDLRGSVEVADLPSGRVCIVHQGDHQRVFIDMDMADAIADAVLAARPVQVAS